MRARSGTSQAKNVAACSLLALPDMRLSKAVCACCVVLVGCGSDGLVVDALGGASWGGHASGGDIDSASAGQTGGGRTGSGNVDLAGAAGKEAGSMASTGGSPPTVNLCTDEHKVRRMRARLTFPDGVSIPTASSVETSNLQATFRITGVLREVIATVDPCQGCSEPPNSLSIRIEDKGSEQVWNLLAEPLELLADWQALAADLVNRDVTLLYRYRRFFQFELSSGFTLSGDHGIVLAAELGPLVSALDPEDLPGFSVTPGAKLCTTEPGCSGVTYHELRFSGDSSATVGLSQDGIFTVGARTYVARNLGAGTPSGDCNDVERASPWAVWAKLPGSL